MKQRHWLLLPLLLLLVACASVASEGLPATLSPPTPTRAATTLVLQASPATATASRGSTLPEYPPLPDGLEEAQVVGVVDGDTVDVRLDGEVVRLRLLGINTPESVDPRRPVQCFGLEASEQAKARLAGQVVLLEADPTQGEWDQYNRLLRYVWFPDGEMFNLEMIAGGFANEYTYNTPYKYQAIFRAAEEEARSNRRGLWSPETCGGDSSRAAPLVDDETGEGADSPPIVPPTATPAPANCDPAYPDVCIPSPPPDLDCGDISFRNFRVLPPDPHRFDGGGDGIGCER